MTITADTITDDQIRELKYHALCSNDGDGYDTCVMALLLNQAARARCAEIFNERSTK